MNAARPSASERLAHIAGAVRAYRPVMAARDGTYFEAAVAIILRETEDDDLDVLFIKRAARADDPWSGQIAFPGGRHDRADLSLDETAKRETREEVGLELQRDGEIIGALDEVRPRTPVLPPVIVRPYVATISRRAIIEAGDEVAATFWAPLRVVLDPSNTRETEINIRGVDSPRPAIHYEGNVIWGMTEYILKSFAKVIA